MSKTPVPSSTESSKPDERSSRQILDDFLSEYVDYHCPVTGQMINATRFELLVASAWMQAMSGKPQYFTNLFDRVLGREPVEVRHAGPSGEPLKLYDKISPMDWDEDDDSKPTDDIGEVESVDEVRGTDEDDEPGTIGFK